MSSRLIAIVVAVAAVACGSSQARRPRRAGQEYLKAIEITGNTAFEDEELVRGLSLHRAQ